VRTDRQSEAAWREQWQRRANLLRERLAVSDVVGRVVTLKKAGAEWIGLCPFHNEKTPSFTVNDRKRFCHCFGCGAHHDAIGFVMARQGLGFREAVELLESENGLRHLQAAAPARPAPRARQAIDPGKAAAVQRIWAGTVPVAAGSPVDRYLRGRCLVPPADYGIGEASINAGWPPDLRFHPELWHADARRGLPAMVAAQRKPDGALAGVHRTYLKVTGVEVVKAGTERDKMMLGDSAGTTIRLSPPADRMIGGEGIETSLAAMQLFRRHGLAFGSRANMAAVEPPFECGDFIYAADRNRPHPDPSRSRVGEAAAHKAAALFGKPMGRTVAVKVPALPPGELGDFNDLLRLRAQQGRGERSAQPSAAPHASGRIEVPT
jgi:DNA primase